MNQLKALQSATSCIDEYIKSLEDRKAQALAFRDMQKIAIEFVQTFPEDMPKEEWDRARTTVGFSLDAGTHCKLYVSWDAKTVEELVEPLRWLAVRLGPYGIDDNPDFNRRVYTFKNGLFMFQAFFWAHSEETVCKYVEVGKKEVPIMELRCTKE